MSDYREAFDIKPFSLGKSDKEVFLTERFRDLSLRHYENCRAYRGFVDMLGLDLGRMGSYYDVPFLPVSLFKELDLLSVPKEDVFKTITSSGTTGQAVSKIFLDKNTSANQQKVLVKIVSDFIGGSRAPMLIIDSADVLKNRSMFSARGAGILGFSVFGANTTYALDGDMNPDIDAIESFLAKHEGKRILLFGFTYIVWQNFFKALQDRGRKLSIPQGILIHGGGWKKLVEEAVSPEEYVSALKGYFGLDKVLDYYGMAEQTGSIYMQCEEGRLHASLFSDVIVRRSKDFSPCAAGEKGIIQVLSTIPESYPGHSLLTEDEGMITGEDDCPCGRLGKTFVVSGRIKEAEIRGCSDTYAAEH